MRFWTTNIRSLVCDIMEVNITESRVYVAHGLGFSSLFHTLCKLCIPKANAKPKINTTHQSCILESFKCHWLVYIVGFRLCVGLMMFCILWAYLMASIVYSLNFEPCIRPGIRWWIGSLKQRLGKIFGHNWSRPCCFQVQPITCLTSYGFFALLNWGILYGFL